MRNIPQYVCGVIPPHILTQMAERTNHAAHGDARATLEHMRELATGRARTLIEPARPAALVAIGSATRSVQCALSPVAHIAACTSGDTRARGLANKRSRPSRPSRFDGALRHPLENAMWNGARWSTATGASSIASPLRST